MPPPRRASAMGLAITNPLVAYRALVATRHIQPDEAQHRLAIRLQELYHRLKDYEPQADYAGRLARLSAAALDASSPRTSPHHQDRDGTTASALRARGAELLQRLRQREADAAARALVRRVSATEAAAGSNAPRGLLLHGEVGTGKSMLVDLLAAGLPGGRTRRVHFAAFMLDALARLERARRRGEAHAGPDVDADWESPALVVAVAREVVAESPVLFLDEFQLPDRAAAKLLAALFTAFFRLGGVLVATSNRLPEELDRAAGADFARPPRRSPLARLSSGLFARASAGGASEAMFATQSDFAVFLEVLRARCDTWDMNGSRDWRRAEIQELGGSGEPGGSEHVHAVGTAKDAADSTGPDAISGQEPRLPSFYFVQPLQGMPAQDERRWQRAVRTAVFPGEAPSDPASLEPPQQIPWAPAALSVYGRRVDVPRAYGGAMSWTFGELCGTALGPADYMSLASTYHTLVLTDVPALTLLQKNEARRLITLLDALYEARCKLLVRAATGPDAVFFPETASTALYPDVSVAKGTNKGVSTASNSARSHSAGGSLAAEPDASYAETLGEIFQDQTAPFRPNIASYDATAAPERSFSRHGGGQRSVLADEDADFGALADAVPDLQRAAAAFTGEDERFAYRRAESRLWEMCGARWWARREEGWWRPLARRERGWEGGGGGESLEAGSGGVGDVHTGAVEEGRAVARDSTAKEPVAGADAPSTSPFRVSSEPPPNIAWTHVWGLMRWGRKAGPWGQGVEGLGARRTGEGRKDGNKT